MATPISMPSRRGDLRLLRVLLEPPARALRRNRIVESITSNCVMSGVASGVTCGGTKDVRKEEPGGVSRMPMTRREALRGLMAVPLAGHGAVTRQTARESELIVCGWDEVFILALGEGPAPSHRRGVVVARRRQSGDCRRHAPVVPHHRRLQASGRRPADPDFFVRRCGGPDRPSDPPRLVRRARDQRALDRDAAR